MERVQEIIRLVEHQVEQETRAGDDADS